MSSAGYWLQQYGGGGGSSTVAAVQQERNKGNPQLFRYLA